MGWGWSPQRGSFGMLRCKSPSQQRKKENIIWEAYVYAYMISIWSCNIFGLSNQYMRIFNLFQSVTFESGSLPFRDDMCFFPLTHKKHLKEYKTQKFPKNKTWSVAFSSALITKIMHFRLNKDHMLQSCWIST